MARSELEEVQLRLMELEHRIELLERGPAEAVPAPDEAATPTGEDAPG